MGIKAMAHDGFDRPDILKYYQAHQKDYAVTAKAKWEQIQIKFTKNGGKAGARKKADEILKRLEDGEVFAVVAKECSNGVTAAKGGLWGWTEQGSLKTKEIEDAVFEQPIGQIGQPVETPTSIDIIRVIDRTDAGYQPFETVQDQIKTHLKNAAFQKRVVDLMKELNENATIEKLTDEPTQISQ
jgi:parvulin-like peptidyl-prolyl isomerase